MERRVNPNTEHHDPWTLSSRIDSMTLVLSKAVFVQLCRIRDASRPKRAAKVSLIGRRAGKRVVIESARRTEALGRRSLPKVVGEAFFHPDGQYLLTPSEKQHISDMLREKSEVA